MSDKKNYLKFKADKEAKRLDLFVTETIKEYSRSKIASAIKNKAILLNDKAAKASDAVKIGDDIEIDKCFFLMPELKGQDVDLDIVYEDQDLLAVNKPAHMLTHPTSVRREGSLVNALMGMNIPLGRIRGKEMSGIVHRLDSETTGLILVAKSDRMQEALMEAFKNRQIKKTYLAILEGNLSKDFLQVKTFMGRDKNDSKKQAVINQGRFAHSEFTLIKSSDKASFVKVDIFTGRTHQIRVHAKYIGHPIVGDKLYGYRKQRHKTDHQLLHAFSLEMQHPFKKEKLILRAKADDEFLRMLTLYSLFPEDEESKEKYLLKK